MEWLVNTVDTSEKPINLITTPAAEIGPKLSSIDVLKAP